MMKKWIQRLVSASVAMFILSLLVGYGSGWFAKPKSIVPVDYFAKFEAVYHQRLATRGGEGVDNPTQNGFRDIMLALGPMAFDVSQTYEEALRDNSPKSKRWWFENEWIPICERFGIDPYVKAPYAHCKGVYRRLSQASKLPESQTASPKFSSERSSETPESSSPSAQNRENEASPTASVVPSVDDTKTQKRDHEMDWKNPTDMVYRLQVTPWRGEDYPAVEAWLDAYSPVFDTLEKAVRKPFYFPYYSPRMPIGGFYGRDISMAHVMAEMFKIRICRRLANDAGRDVDGAIRDVETLFLLMRHYQQCPEPAVQMSVPTFAPITFVRDPLLREGKLNDAQLARLQHFLANLPLAPLFADLMQYEEYDIRDMAQTLGNHPDDFADCPQWLFDFPNQALGGSRLTRASLRMVFRFPPDSEALVAVTQRAIDEMRPITEQSDPTKRRQMYDQWLKTNHVRMGTKGYGIDSVWRIFSPQRRAEATAAAMVEQPMNILLATIQIVERTENEIRLCQIGIALERYRLAQEQVAASKPSEPHATDLKAHTTESNTAYANVIESPTAEANGAKIDSVHTNRDGASPSGVYPKTLAQLVTSGWMDAVPLDVCGARPFVYRLGRFTLPKVVDEPKETTDSIQSQFPYIPHYSKVRAEKHPFLLYALGSNGVDDTAVWIESGKMEVHSSEYRQNDDCYF